MSAPGEERLRTSTRDLSVLRGQVEDWLRGRLPGASGVTVSEPEQPGGNGMSSETLMFTASWTEAGTPRTVECVARLAPAEEAVPVFPAYDLGRQFRLMRLARERAGVPAPRALWFETDPRHLGTPFFVMERERGLVPPDVLPYTFEGWLLDASPAERALLQRESVAILARLHDAPYADGELAFLGPADHALRRHVDEQRAYYRWAHAERPIPVLERAFAWLEDHWPEDPGTAVLNWGDARIGNVIYRDFRPAAVLDWEMAALAPREVDLAWMTFLHRFFQDIAEALGLPGLPDFMRPSDVCAQYAEMTGYEPRDLRFYEMYAALRHGVIMGRVWRRRVRFGEQPEPEDPDDLVMHRATIERMLDGRYWA
ncbi:phosphotransferase family protein [Bailinhaonella thermotolerans]|uniref:Phosphotransferase family protein n=1 Tax=Bailinhaonella thermotolerans TaxID=1070861 RepID=A0A3A4BB35_9ACTN|nr:phosphotransferase family protein [Bailinhaonella thermotolerans]RJL31418.1 phosphotransferase family protein [Bailinhaonella thermotolerans]